MTEIVIALVGLVIFGILSIIQIHIISKSKPKKFKSWTAYGHMEIEYDSSDDQ